MPAYLVRLNDECGEHARDLVGIFVAETVEQLFWLVDEARLPDECEYLELTAGGIYWERYTGTRVPRDEEPNWDVLPEDWSPLPAAPALTDAWNESFASDGDRANDEWQPIVWALGEDEAAALTPGNDPEPGSPPRPTVMPVWRRGRSR